MYKNLLNNKFFKDNPIQELSVQYLLFISLQIEDLDEIVKEYVSSFIDRAEEQKLQIAQESNPDTLFKLLRGGCDTLCQDLLRKRILEYEDVLLPRIISVYTRTLNNIFVENVVRIIPRCKKNYTKELLRIFPNIRTPYALSLICIVLGFIGDEDTIPILYKQYEDFKKLNSRENFEQGPLIGLSKLKERFCL